MMKTCSQCVWCIRWCKLTILIAVIFYLSFESKVKEQKYSLFCVRSDSGCAGCLCACVDVFVCVCAHAWCPFYKFSWDDLLGEVFRWSKDLY